MNMPGRADGNWRWRCTEDMLSDLPFEWLRDADEGLEPYREFWRVARLVSDAVFTSPSHPGTHETEVTR